MKREAFMFSRFFLAFSRGKFRACLISRWLESGFALQSFLCKKRIFISNAQHSPNSYNKYYLMR